MTHARLRVSIVCPAYEEAEGLPHFHAALANVLAPLQDRYTFEIIYVDDGSSDGTLEVLRELARKDPRVRYLSLSRNFGGQAATTAGLEHATGAAVISLDSDLQHPPELIPLLLEHWQEGNDVVLTHRESDPTVGWFRRWAARSFFGFFNRVAVTPLPRAICDYRLLSRKALDALLRCHETHRLLRGLVSWLGFRTAFVPFRPAARTHGTTKYTLSGLFNLAADSMLSFSRLPLRLAFGLGAFFLAAGALLLLGGLVHQGLWGGTSWGLLLLAATVTMNGCVLLILGIVGEYVGRIYEQVKSRPLYVLKETSDDRVRGPNTLPEEAA
jgi:dolichol-phosphate mannosyltransferase